jgi:RNA polymerase sigma-70 factor (ECF subfamily)
VNVAANAPSIEIEEPMPAALSWNDQFEELVRRHSRLVYRVAYSVVRNAHDAEDVAQETFLKVYRGRRWEGIENEQAFLAKAAWRLAVDRRKRPAGAELIVEAAAPGRNPEEAAIAADRSALVARLIDALPEELRQPLALSTVDEMTSVEIAAVMEIPEATVRGRLMRARQMLREKLAAYAR